MTKYAPNIAVAAEYALRQNTPAGETFPCTLGEAVDFLRAYEEATGTEGKPWRWDECAEALGQALGR